MKFEERCLLSWLFPDNSAFSIAQLWEKPHIQGNFGSIGSLNKSLNELIKRGFVKKEDGLFSKTEAGIQKSRTIKATKRH
jgi:hypothetical protein